MEEKIIKLKIYKIEIAEHNKLISYYEIPLKNEKYLTIYNLINNETISEINKFFLKPRKIRSSHTFIKQKVYDLLFSSDHLQFLLAVEIIKQRIKNIKK